MWITYSYRLPERRQSTCTSSGELLQIFIHTCLHKKHIINLKNSIWVQLHQVTDFVLFDCVWYSLNVLHISHTTTDQGAETHIPKHLDIFHMKHMHFPYLSYTTFHWISTIIPKTLQKTFFNFWCASSFLLLPLLPRARRLLWSVRKRGFLNLFFILRFLFGRGTLLLFWNGCVLMAGRLLWGWAYLHNNCLRETHRRCACVVLRALGTGEGEGILRKWEKWRWPAMPFSLSQ